MQVTPETALPVFLQNPFALTEMRFERIYTEEGLFAKKLQNTPKRKKAPTVKTVSA